MEGVMDKTDRIAAALSELARFDQRLYTYQIAAAMVGHDRMSTLIERLRNDHTAALQKLREALDVPARRKK